MDYLFLVDQRAPLAVQDRIKIIFDPFENNFWIIFENSIFLKFIFESFGIRFFFESAFDPIVKNVEK